MFFDVYAIFKDRLKILSRSVLATFSLTLGYPCAAFRQKFLSLSAYALNGGISAKDFYFLCDMNNPAIISAIPASLPAGSCSAKNRYMNIAVKAGRMLLKALVRVTPMRRIV